MLLIGRAPGGGGARVRSKTLASYWPERRRLRTLGSSEELKPLVFSRKSFPSRLLNVTSRPWGVGGPWERGPPSVPERLSAFVPEAPLARLRAAETKHATLQERKHTA